ncbi:hypothetical protein GA0061082_10729 [Snodgrassella sp. R-53583]|nr:hypothetical protein GA0061082_10729 [Snodgrassella sp. R-53583]
MKKACRARYAVVHIYKNIINELNQSSDPEDKKLAKQLAQYIRNIKKTKPQSSNSITTKPRQS